MYPWDDDHTSSHNSFKHYTVISEHIPVSTNLYCTDISFKHC